jgi:hypothetical protein
VSLKNIYSIITAIILSTPFTAVGNTAPMCSMVFSSNFDAKPIVSGKQTAHYYSGFGSSYGKNPLTQLKGYLEIGARLSPRGWDLFQKIKNEAHPSVSDKDLARIIVNSLHPETLDSKDKIDYIRSNLKSEKSTEIILNELKSINQDIQIFKKNTKDVFELFKSVDLYYHQNRQKPWFQKSLHELHSFKKTAAFRKYSSAYIPLFQQRWSDSLDPIENEIFSSWKKRLNIAMNEADYVNLSKEAQDLLNRQLQRKAGGLFYSNYGGLYNKKDRSLVWYAAGESSFSRESFDSIQSFFSKEGITFEFKDSAKKRILWDQTLSLERKSEANILARQGLTYDIVSMSGNLIPEDISRVYVTTPELLQKTKSLFQEILGNEELQKSDITFHLASEQSEIHERETNKIMSKADLGSEKLPVVKPIVMGSSTYFLSSSEIQNIQARKRPLKYLIELKDGKNGLDSLKTLIQIHSQVDSTTPIQNSQIVTGGYWKYPDGSMVYLNPSQEVQIFRGSKNIYLEIRPEVSKEQIDSLISSGFQQEFDFRIISRVYFPDSSSASDARAFYFKHFGVQNLYKWSQKFDSTHNIERNYDIDWTEFHKGIEGKSRNLNLDQADLLELDLSNFRNTVNLFDVAQLEKMRNFLSSSQNFGISPYFDLKKTMTANEFNVWTKLQDLVLEKAKQRAPLSLRVVDEFLLMAAQSSSNHAPVGYRVDQTTHEIWPGGRKLGNHWLFNLQESQHFYREPFFELPETVYRSSPTELIVNRLSFRSPGDLREQIKILIKKYNIVKQNQSPELAAFLFYKDLIALHPLTDGNGRGSRALLSYLLLSEGIPAPSFERISIADLYVTGQDSMKYLEMGIWRGWQSISFGGPPKN